MTTTAPNREMLIAQVTGALIAHTLHPGQAQHPEDAAEKVIGMVARSIAAAIEAYQVDAHPPVCPPSIAWEAGRERAVAIVRQIGGEA